MNIFLKPTLEITASDLITLTHFRFVFTAVMLGKETPGDEGTSQVSLLTLSVV